MHNAVKSRSSLFLSCLHILPAAHICLFPVLQFSQSTALLLWWSDDCVSSKKLVQGFWETFWYPVVKCLSGLIVIRHEKASFINKLMIKQLYIVNSAWIFYCLCIIVHWLQSNCFLKQQQFWMTGSRRAWCLFQESKNKEEGTHGMERQSTPLTAIHLTACVWLEERWMEESAGNTRMMWHICIHKVNPQPSWWEAIALTTEVLPQHGLQRNTITFCTYLQCFQASSHAITHTCPY